MFESSANLFLEIPGLLKMAVSHPTHPRRAKTRPFPKRGHRKRELRGALFVYVEWVRATENKVGSHFHQSLFAELAGAVDDELRAGQLLQSHRTSCMDAGGADAYLGDH